MSEYLLRERTEWEEARDLYSDFHKDAYGFRPRNDVSSWTLEDFEAQFVIFRRVCQENEKAREASETQASMEFEAKVVELISMGAADRDTAIRWFHEAERTNGDNNYLCFCLGLPYEYFSGH